MGGDSKFSVPVGPRRGRSRMGGGDLQKKSDWSQNCPLNAKLSHFCYFKHEIQLFKVLLSLKAVKFDTKMYFNLSNFRGRISAGGGGTSLGPKTGTSVGWGDWQNFCRMGGTPSPPRKKTLHRWNFTKYNFLCYLFLVMISVMILSITG